MRAVLGAAGEIAEVAPGIALAAVMFHAAPGVGTGVHSVEVALEASAGAALGRAARGALLAWDLRGAAVVLAAAVAEEVAVAAVAEEVAAAVAAAEEAAVAGGSQL